MLLVWFLDLCNFDIFINSNFTRVSAPIVYNFMDLLKIKESAFDLVMVSMNIVPVIGGAS